MAADLRRFASGEAILARRPAMHERCWRWIARRPAIVVLTLLLGVVLVGASMKIASLQREKLRLAGFRPVHVTTTPSGAYVALVPIDRNTNEPSSDPALVVRPFGKTPLMTSLRPGDYLVEAVIPNGDTPEFAEVYRSVPDLTRLSSSTKRFNLAKGFDPETCHFSKIRIVPQSELIQTMVEVSIPEHLHKIIHYFQPDCMWILIKRHPRRNVSGRQEIGSCRLRTTKTFLTFPISVAPRGRNRIINACQVLQSMTQL